MRPLLLGEAPSRTGDRYWRFPLSGGPARSICTWMGWEPEGSTPGGWYWALRERFDTVNLVERWPGPQGKGAAFPMSVARPAWEEFGRHVEHRVVVVLGARLQRLASLAGPHQWATSTAPDGRRLDVVAVPHTSGLNLVYNDVAERERTAVTLREAMERAS